MDQKPVPVEIVETRARPTVAVLADGAELQISLLPVSIHRVPGKVCEDGSPVYTLGYDVKTATIVMPHGYASATQEKSDG